MTVARPEDPILAPSITLRDSRIGTGQTLYHWTRLTFPIPRYSALFPYATESDITITAIAVTIFLFIPAREQQQKYRQLTIQQTYNQRHNTHLVFLLFRD